MSPVHWDELYMGLTEKYGFTPKEIGELTRNQLLIYCGTLEGAKSREKMLYRKMADRAVHSEKGTG